MSITKKDLSRRDFIKQLGLAAGVGLPFLSSEVAMGQTTTAPVRVLIVPIQHGWGHDPRIQRFTGTPTSFTLPDIVKGFESIKNQCVFVDGLRTSYWGNAHDVSYSDILTCAVRVDDANSSALGGPFPVPRGPSIDWLIGNYHNKKVLRLCHNYSSWGADYHPLSFAQSGTSFVNQAYYTSAYAAYMDVINPLKQQQQGPTPAQTAGNNALFSFLGKDAEKLIGMVTGAERTKMENYLSALNSLGTRILNPGTSSSGVVLPNLPGMTLGFNDQMDQYLEMIRVAFTLDTHRVAVLGLGEGISNWNWTDTSGAARVGNTFGNDFHHEIAHYGQITTKNNPRAAYEGWIKWYSSKIVGFVNKLNTIIDVDGRTLLDNTIIVLTGEVGNGEHHRHDSLHIVIGGGGNKISRGRWISTPKVDLDNRMGIQLGARLPNGTIDTNSWPYDSYVSRHHAADLWVKVAQLAGLNITTFGQDIYNYQPIQL